MNRQPVYLKDGEIPERVYYGNVCSVCFSKENLRKCTVCKKVQYCSEEHQQADLRFHNRVCSVVVEANRPDFNGGREYSFYLYRYYMMIHYMVEKRYPYPLNRYEKEICMLPWVCIVCWKNDDLKYECEKCGSVAYCSMEHKQKDATKHNSICSRLHVCRLFASLGFENGAKIESLNVTYQPTLENVTSFPTDMKGLLKILQNKIEIPYFDEISAINAGVFTDRYAAAATILSCLEKIGLITDRKFNWLPNKRLYEITDMTPRPNNPNRNRTRSGQLVIHMVGAYDYELQIPWGSFAGFIVDWLTNVHHVKVILVGWGLRGFNGVLDEGIRHIARIESHQGLYKHAVNRVDPPDVVIMHNIYYPNNGMMKDLDHEGFPALFKYSRVPLILTSPFVQYFEQMAYWRLKSYVPEVELISDVSSNLFCEVSAVRNWEYKEGLSVGQQNEFIAVYMKK